MGFRSKGRSKSLSTFTYYSSTDDLRYHIRVGRSKSITGPFVDKSGKKLLDGHGETVYGSNNGNVYAPGGVGVLPGNGKRGDVLYHHFCEFPHILMRLSC
jgi:arabinan endo-1,5-alpha-L-arabinosidase